MTPLSLEEPTGRYLSFAEREEIALLKAQDKGVREIARTIGRDPGTVSRELRRNAATRGGKPVCRAVVAQWKAQQAAKRPKTAKLVSNVPSRADPRSARSCTDERAHAPLLRHHHRMPQVIALPDGSGALELSDVGGGHVGSILCRDADGAVRWEAQ
jgi:hypothetical protein